MLHFLQSLYLPKNPVYESIQDQRSQKLFYTYLPFIQLSMIFFTIFYYTIGRTTAFYIQITHLIIIIAIAIFYKKTQRYSRSFVLAFITITSLIFFLRLTNSSLIYADLLWFQALLFPSIVAYNKKNNYFMMVIILILGLASFILPLFFHSLKDESISAIHAFYINIFIFIAASIFSYVTADKIIEEHESVYKWVEKQKNTFEHLNIKNATLISILSHDLATPVMVTKYAIKKSSIDENEKTELLDHMSQIETLIHDVRALRSAEAGKISIKLKPVNLYEICQNAVKKLSTKCKEKNIHISILTDSNDFIINADSNSLETSVINNLLTNAIKFSSSGQKISIEIERLNNKVRLAIKDQGIGIPKELIPYLFDFSYSTSRSGTNNEKGTGFGLPIVKLFVDIFKAEISVTSSETKPTGTTFTILFDPYDEKDTSIS